MVDARSEAAQGALCKENARHVFGNARRIGSRLASTERLRQVLRPSCVTRRRWLRSRFETFAWGQVTCPRNPVASSGRAARTPSVHIPKLQLMAKLAAGGGSMGLRFRQSFTLFPGVRLNLSKSGMSASFGVPGATVNVGPRGARGTGGGPGSGLSYSTVLPPAGRGAPAAAPTYWQPPQGFAPQPGQLAPEPSGVPAPYLRAPGMRAIGSAAVESLTSAGLLQFQAIIVDAGRQRREIENDLGEAKAEHGARKGELGRKRKSLFRFLFKKRIAELEEVVPKLAAEVERLEGWLEATHIEVQFDADDAAQRAYGSLIRAYEALRSCAVVWDVTSDRDTNRVAERTTASRVVERRRVALDYSKSDLIRFDGRALRFANANGEDILIYPGVILMQRADGAFALLDLREVGSRANQPASSKTNRSRPTPRWSATPGPRRTRMARRIADSTATTKSRCASTAASDSPARPASRRSINSPTPGRRSPSGRPLKTIRRRCAPLLTMPTVRNRRRR